MAKVVFKKTPHAAYEYAEVQGGDTMKDFERAALLDEFVAENRLVPVETTFVGDIPTHKYGRYIAGGVAASALPPALPGRENDLIKVNDELAAARAEIARLNAQLGKQPEKSKAEIVEPLPIVAPLPIGTSGGGGQSTEDARATLSQNGPAVLPTSEQVREDNSTADRSTDNQVVEEAGETKKATRGRPKKDD